MVRFVKRIDLLLLLPAFLLSALGLLMIYSISYEADPSFFIRQAIYILLSIVVFFTLANLDFKTITHLATPLYISLIIILVLTLTLGTEIRGSVRWLDLGFVRVQGAELAKPILVLVLATFFARYRAAKFKNFCLSALIAAVPIVLVALQPNLSNSLILSCLWVFMIFISGVNLFYLIGTGVGFLLAAPVVWNFLLAGYQKTRILAFINPGLDPQGASYNVVQALIALGSGQLFGEGLGRGTQSHLNFLPEGRTDFILAAAGEELGYLGVSLIILIFAFLIYRILKIAWSIKNSQGALFVYGGAFTIILQFFINAGMNMGIFPVSGVTLPFVSFGGSSVVSMFVLLGLVQSAKNDS